MAEVEQTLAQKILQMLNQAAESDVVRELRELPGIRGAVRRSEEMMEPGGLADPMRGMPRNAQGEPLEETIQPPPMTDQQKLHYIMDSGGLLPPGMEKAAPDGSLSNVLPVLQGLGAMEKQALQSPAQVANVSPAARPALGLPQPNIMQALFRGRNVG